MVTLTHKQTEKPAAKKVPFIHLSKELLKPNKDSNSSHAHQSLKTQSNTQRSVYNKGTFPQILTA